MNSDVQIETIFKNAPDAIIIINHKGIIRQWNPAAEKMFGWTLEEVIGRPLNEFIVPQGYWEIHLKAMGVFLETGEGIILNKPIVQPALRKNLPPIEVEFIVSPAKFNKENLFIGFLRDVTEKNRALEALRESEENNRLLTSEVHDYAIVMLSPEGNITSWNEGAQRIKGYTENEIIGKHFSVFYTREDIQSNVPEMQLEIVRKEGRHENEGWRVKKDGSLFLANVVLTALMRKNKIIGYSKITRDITAIKKAEEEIRILNTELEQRVVERTEALQQSEKKYRNLFENSPIPMWVIESSTQRFLDVNEAALAHYGYSRQEFFSLSFSDIRPSDEKIKILNFDHSDSGGVLNSGFVKHLKKNGSVIYVESNSHELMFGNRPALLVTSIDVSERKKAEERLEVALEAGKIGIWEMDMVNDSSIRNARTDQIFGNEQSDWSKKTILEQVHGQDERQVRKAFEEALLVKTLNIEFRIVLPGDNIRWIIITGKIVEDNLLNVQKMLGTVIDITDYKRAEEKIRMLNNDLEQRVKRRTRELDAAVKELESFSYSVSHDLRAPLRAINGYSQILNENYKERLDEEGQRMLSRVMINTKKMGQLIDDLLEFSRLGKASLKQDLIDLNPVVQEAITELGNVVSPGYKITLSDLGMAYADRVIIRQVFQNLLSNAIKYSSKKENPEISIGITETEKGKAYYIKDNGAGFDMTYYNKLFGVFQRLHRQDEFEGTGVGLAIVQKIVSRHGGEVWAEGVPDVGATFFFTLANDLREK